MPDPTVLVHAPHAVDAPAAWYTEAAPPSAGRAAPTDDQAMRARWYVANARSAQSLLRPAAFTDAKAPRVFWGKSGRFGTAFGSVVHHAIGGVLAGETVEAAVRRVAAALGLRRYLAEAVDDVRRAISTLAALGIPGEGVYRLEYPVAGASPSGDLLGGYVDLVATLPTGPILLDFKTDARDAEVPATYVSQVRGYAGVIAAGLGVAALRAGLLFTSDGSVQWLSSDAMVQGRAGGES